MDALDKLRSLKAHFLFNTEDLKSEEMLRYLSHYFNAECFLIDEDNKILDYALSAPEQREFFSEALESGYLELLGFDYDLSEASGREYEIGQRSLLHDNKDWAVRTAVYAIPIIDVGNKVYYIILFKFDDSFERNFPFFAEAISLMFSLLLRYRNDNGEGDDEVLKEQAIQALDSLSYTEKKAMRILINQLEGKSGIVVASRIADEYGITRSIIVNALRKLDMAGLINVTSMGMRGTNVEILNEMLKNALND